MRGVGPGFDREPVIASVRCARLEDDLVSRFGVVDSRLEIAARRDVDGRPRWCNHAAVDVVLRQGWLNE